MRGDSETIAGDIVGRLELAWNAGDGDAFAAPFADDADFVTVRGEFYRTREGVAHGHRLILSTIYKDSTNSFDLLRVRTMGAGLILAHVRAKLSVPAGPLAGEHVAVMSMVLACRDGTWEITAFHNTLRPPTAPGREQLAEFMDLAAD
jgi:uncharacterized protein (TIGR02246 family)